MTAAIVPIVSIESVEDPRLADMALERHEDNRIFSPWFGTDFATDREHLYHFGSRYQLIRDASLEAFTKAIGVTRRECMMQSKNNPDGRVLWRIHTAFPQPVPEKPEAPPPVKLSAEMRGAIDV